MKWSDTGGGDFEQPPVGTHIARCIKLIDLGTQKGEYQGKATFKRQCIIGWELPNALMSDGDNTGKPFVVSKFYTSSLGEKANLRADLKNWRGREFTQEELNGFEAKNILGAYCMLSITENDKKKARVTGVMALPKGMEKPEGINTLVYFSLEPEEFNKDVFESISKGIKAMIEVSPEYINLTKQPAIPPLGESFSNFDDDIPF